MKRLSKENTKKMLLYISLHCSSLLHHVPAEMAFTPQGTLTALLFLLLILRWGLGMIVQLKKLCVLIFLHSTHDPLHLSA